MIGTLLNERYLIQSELGRGGMGVVYRGWDNLLERDVAVKVLTAAGLGTEGRTRLLQEARAAASLNHPNIVAVHDVGVHDVGLHQSDEDGPGTTTAYIVMEFVKGQNLAQFQPETLEQTVGIVIQICSALEEAHARGIVHRDLKPENVAITPAGTVKLMDFGLAKAIDETPLEGSLSLSGTLAYIAPEVLLGEPASAQSDLYALGVMFFELVCGRLPFSGDDLATLLSNSLTAPVTPPSAYVPDLPPTLDALIVRLLSRRPQHRPPSAANAGEVLKKWLASSHDLLAVDVATAGVLGYLARGRLVGRDLELAELTKIWRAVMGGQGRFALISGEPGIGKTRLARELAAYAEISGGRVLTAECFDEAFLPYMPFANIIGGVLSQGFDPRLPDPILADLLVLAPELQLAYPEVAERLLRDRETERQHMFESVVTLFAALTTAGPVMLCIDDLHWADSGTLSLLEHLAKRMRQRRLLIVGTYREVEVTEERPFQQAFADMNQERLVERLKLSRLDRYQTQKLLETLFSTSLRSEFADRIFQETEGNPLFVEEVCKALVESGKIYFQDGEWHRGELDALDIPQGVQMAIQSRLGKLAEEDQSTLQTAAILGREFRFDMLQKVSDLGEDQLITSLEKALRAQLIEEVSPARGTYPGETSRSPALEAARGPAFSFTHALIHSTLLAKMGTLRRQRGQYRIACAIEEAFPDKMESLAPMLGRYFAEAGEGEKAVFYLLLAGDAAHRLFAYDEAIKAYEQALLFLEEGAGDGRAARTYMKLGLIYHNTFRFERSRRAYEAGFARWQLEPADTTFELGKESYTFRTHLIDTPTIDPTRTIHFNASIIVQQLFSGLVELRPGNEIIPNVARSWEVLDRGRRYIFHLRDDVYWSDGRPVTAADFEFAWKRVLHPESGHYPAELLFDIRAAEDYYEGRITDPDLIGIQTVDDRTLHIELEGPAGYFLHLLAQSIGLPVPRHVVQRYEGAWTNPGHIVTNGPFLLQDWRPGVDITLARNPHFHGLARGNLERVIVSFLDSAALALEQYQAGALDCLQITPLFSPDDHDRARQRFPGDYLSGPQPSVRFLAFNVRRPPFDDLAVRRAFALAVDKGKVADVSLRGLYPPAEGGFVPPGLPGHQPGIALAYDPEEAAELLARAGYPGGAGFPTITARTSGGETYQVMAEMLTSLWREHLGIEVRFQPMPPGADAHIWLAGVTPDYPDPDSFLRVNNWSQTTGWRHEAFERVVEEARRVPDLRQRLEMYRQAEVILADEVSLLPLVYGRFHTLLKPSVRQYPASSLSVPYWKDVVVQPE